LHRVGWQTVPLRVSARLPVLQLDQADLVRADPQCTLPVLHESGDPDVGHRHAAEFVDARETDAVELDQAGLSAQPQISIASLRDRIDRRLWQALLCLPDAMDVLGERSRGIERVRVTRQCQHDQQNR
jgi:hypothetical protein